jgi:hypothetical protein
MSPVSQDDDDDDEDLPSKTSAPATTTSSTIKSISSNDGLSGELAMEIDSLNNMSRRTHDDAGNDVFVRTPLPSFSTIIGNVAAATTTTCSNDASLLSVLQSSSVPDLSSHDHHMILNDDRNDEGDGQVGRTG